jgi:hypothetical protein
MFEGVLYSVSYLLVPKMHHDFPVAHLNNFVPVVKPRYLNLAQVVLCTIGRASVHAHYNGMMVIKRLFSMDVLNHFRYNTDKRTQFQIIYICLG